MAVAVSASARVPAQEVSGPALKAAFLLNFVRFADWPDRVIPAAAPFVLCVRGDESVADVLESIVKGHPVKGHELIVTRVVANTALRGCHLLYMADSVGLKDSTAMMQSLANAPTLTVSDLAGFAQAGGMVNLIVEGARIRLAINIEAATRASVRISSKLLMLAVVVSDQSSAHAR